MTDGSATGKVDAVAIGRRLKEARAALRLSQAELAQKNGSSKTGLQANEAGKSVPGGQLLACMSEAGISADWLLTGDGSMWKGSAPVEAVTSASLDVELLQLVLSKVETHVAKVGVKVNPAKKAEFVALLYDYVVETGKSEGPSVDRILRLVA